MWSKQKAGYFLLILNCKEKVKSPKIRGYVFVLNYLFLECDLVTLNCVLPLFKMRRFADARLMG